MFTGIFHPVYVSYCYLNFSIEKHTANINSQGHPRSIFRVINRCWNIGQLAKGQFVPKWMILGIKSEACNSLCIWNFSMLFAFLNWKTPQKPFQEGLRRWIFHIVNGCSNIDQKPICEDIRYGVWAYIFHLVLLLWGFSISLCVCDQ